MLDPNTFTTEDTALAAYLVYLGFRLIAIDNHNRLTTFTFERTSEAIDKARESFELGIAVGNILLFFRAYKKLLHEAVRDRSRQDNNDSRS